MTNAKNSLDIYSRLPDVSRTPASDELDRHELDKAFALCPNSSPTRARDIEHKEPHLLATGCRRWDCTICGNIKRYHLVKRITAAAPTKFITLTCRHEGAINDQLKTITDKFQSLIKLIRKKQQIEYIRITEDCVDGYPHFHVLARTAFINQTTLSRQWQELTNASIVDIRKAHGASTRYVAKYVGKNLTRADARQRYGVSRQFFLPKQKQPTDLFDFNHVRQGFLEHVEYITQESSLETQNIGRWQIVERQPGDELPPEIQKLYPTPNNKEQGPTSTM